MASRCPKLERSGAAAVARVDLRKNQLNNDIILLSDRGGHVLIGRERLHRNKCSLFSDTKLGEYHPKKIIGRKFTGDVTQCALCQPQLLGQ